MIISSQKYINEEIVEQKIADSDFAVTLSPVFVVDGVEMQTVIDGHHSLEAAKISGINPEYHVAEASECDAIYLLDDSIDDFLVATRIDCDYYDIATGVDVW